MIGNTDVEDALRRLDRLTLEEAQMASLELLRVSHNVEGRVICIGESVQGVGDKVQDVGDGVQDVQQLVQGLGDKVDQVNRESSSERNLPDSSNPTNLRRERPPRSPSNLALSSEPIH